jgi:hypothetical protein
MKAREVMVSLACRRAQLYPIQNVKKVWDPREQAVSSDLIALHFSDNFTDICVSDVYESSDM